MRKGRQSYLFDKPPYIISTYSIAGPKEGEGAFGRSFSLVLKDDLWGEKTFEKCEIKMHREAVKSAIAAAKTESGAVDAIIAADLLNQIIAASFAAKDIDAAFLGIYGACSSFGEAMALGSMLVSGEFFDNVSCSTSSHFASAERQYRFPLELGNQRTPTAQWTVTAAGCSVLGKNPPETKSEKLLRVDSCTFGKVVDYGIDDESNMGAAMAPAAAATLSAHFKEMQRSPNYYDEIWTGDLGKYGSELLRYLLQSEDIVLGGNYRDAGAEYYVTEQHPVQGGSGAGCSASVFNGYIADRMRKGEVNRVLVCPTGALLSKDTPLQGATIPAVAHAFSVQTEEF